ncbi:hypothetical protein [Enhygromyxa salina]|uniref:Lipoprotein n=1 Tax=Enhygromyxa salina TaxID=215803 RepID=A0A2S9YLZ8_9BACT|nr:hypothetical protein [Enhygromyxa salina]PRQ06103.1 hypothetical protein ENSA7_41370 [Enhygromyxa salina]
MSRCPLLLSVSLLLGVLGCGVEVCESASTPEAFAGIADDLPSQMVFCVPDADGGADRPNAAHVNFQVDTPHDAWITVVDHFESKGWERLEQQTGENLLSVKFGHLETGYVINFGTINENRAESPIKKHRVHGHVNISKAPCLEKFGEDDTVCVDNTLVHCTLGMPTQEIDCSADLRSCAGERYGNSACVSDLCLATKAGTGKWDPASCPPELVKP